MVVDDLFPTSKIREVCGKIEAGCESQSANFHPCPILVALKRTEFRRLPYRSG